MKNIIILICLVSIPIISKGENVFTTKVHVVEINPLFFNWSIQNKHDYSYKASLVNYPDLPNWLTYTYSSRYRSGFLYGVPSDLSPVQIQVIGLNYDTFETKRKVINFNITEKPDPAKFEIQMKIDNLNVEDMFDKERVDSLIEVIIKNLWQQVEPDIYVTFLASAVRLGARLPLSPNDGEGVVVHLGSRYDFSQQLLELQDEVRPLWKMGPCPRDFKRTTVDRHFRASGFALDWCSFRLRVINEVNDRLSPAWQSESGWELPDRNLLPVRSYTADLLATLAAPLAILLVLILLLSFILCFHHDVLYDQSSDDFLENLFFPCEDYFRSKDTVEDEDNKLERYEAVQRATSTLRSLSNNRETAPSTSPRMIPKVEEDVSRPSPPPYGANRRMVHMDS